MELVTSMFPFNLKSILRAILLEFRDIIFSPASSWLASHGLIDTRSWQHIHKFSMTSRECQIWKSLDLWMSWWPHKHGPNQHSQFDTEFLFPKEEDRPKSIILRFVSLSLFVKWISYFILSLWIHKTILGANFGFRCLYDIFLWRQKPGVWSNTNSEDYFPAWNRKHLSDRGFVDRCEEILWQKVTREAILNSRFPWRDLLRLTSIVWGIFW